MKETLKRILYIYVLLFYALFPVVAYETPCESTVFVQGENDGAYDCYRIPSIVSTTSGTLLAFCEGRVDTCSDYGDIDIVLKRSTNGGSSWGTRLLIDSEGTNRLHNPCPVIDRDNGRIYIFYCKNGRDICYKYSDNDGINWSARKEIMTYPVDVDITNGSIHTGPCHGIQLFRSPYQGRLVIPYRYITSGGIRKIRLLYSDDGSTWTHSGRIIGEGFFSGINEMAVEELTNGNIYFNMRNQGANDSDEKYRIVCQSSDCLTNHITLESTGNYFDKELPEPKCQGSVLKIASIDLGDSFNQILFANPATKVDRRFMTIRSSFDETDSWSRNKLITTRRCGYSDMVMLDKDYIGILYESGYLETGSDAYNERIVFTGFHRNWLAEPTVAAWEFEEKNTGSYALSSNTAYNNICFGLHGNVSGMIKYVAGQDSGTALEFTSGDYITIDDTYTNNSLDFYAGETFWVKAKINTTNHNSGGTSGSGSIIAKDWGPMKKSWWLRIQDGKVRFLICDGNVECSVTSSIAVADGNWHTVLAGRDVYDDKLKVYIDGVLCGEQTDESTGGLKNGQDITIANFNNASRQFIGKMSTVSVMHVEPTPVLMNAPEPNDNATDIPMDCTLSWSIESAENITSQTVVIATDKAMENVVQTVSTTGNTAEAVGLDDETTYYWRVDVTGLEAEVPFNGYGPVWSFRTASCEIELSNGDLNGDCVVDYEDFMIIANNWLDTG